MDVRDAVGDRLHLSGNIRRDGVSAFRSHPGQNLNSRWGLDYVRRSSGSPTEVSRLKYPSDLPLINFCSSHGETQSLREIVTAANKKSGGLFAAFHSQSSSYRPTYNHMPAGDACRIYGSFSVKRVTGTFVTLIAKLVT